MSGLRGYARDAAPLFACGDGRLAPPSEAELLALACALLARPAAPQPTAARWVYARWKPGTSLTAGFELDYADGERRWVSWKRYAGGKAEDLARRRERPVAAEAADTRLLEHAILPANGAHLWAPPFDRELPGLERGSDLRRAKRWFLEQGLFPGRAVRSGSSRAQLLRYKPERRAVLRLDLRLRPLAGGEKTAETLAARALPPEEAARIARARIAWQEGPRARIGPRMVAWEERAGLVYEEWLEVDTCAHDAFELACEAGELLARLHAECAPEVVPASVQEVSAAAALLATQPELCGRVRPIDAPVRASGADRVWVHGDFHTDQLARGRRDGALRLLDLDRLGPGRPHEDLGSWIADHLVERPDDGLRAAGAALLDGYASARGRPPRRAELALAVAEALVQRAAGALRRLEAGAPAKAARLLDLAREIAPKGALFP